MEYEFTFERHFAELMDYSVVSCHFYSVYSKLSSPLEWTSRFLQAKTVEEFVFSVIGGGLLPPLPDIIDISSVGQFFKTEHETLFSIWKRPEQAPKAKGWAYLYSRPGQISGTVLIMVFPWREREGGKLELGRFYIGPSEDLKLPEELPECENPLVFKVNCQAASLEKEKHAINLAIAKWLARPRLDPNAEHGERVKKFWRLTPAQRYNAFPLGFSQDEEIFEARRDELKARLLSGREFSNPFLICTSPSNFEERIKRLEEINPNTVKENPLGWCFSSDDPINLCWAEVLNMAMKNRYARYCVNCHSPFSITNYYRRGRKYVLVTDDRKIYCPRCQRKRRPSGQREVWEKNRSQYQRLYRKLKQGEMTREEFAKQVRALGINSRLGKDRPQRTPRRRRE